MAQWILILCSINTTLFILLLKLPQLLPLRIILYGTVYLCHTPIIVGFYFVLFLSTSSLTRTIWCSRIILYIFVVPAMDLAIFLRSHEFFQDRGSRCAYCHRMWLLLGPLSWQSKLIYVYTNPGIVELQM